MSLNNALFARYAATQPVPITSARNASAIQIDENNADPHNSAPRYVTAALVKKKIARSTNDWGGLGIFTA